MKLNFLDRRMQVLIFFQVMWLLPGNLRFLSFLNAIRTKNLTTTTFDQLNQQVVRTDDWEIAP